MNISNKILIPVLVLLWATSASADVEINETNFPDENFRAWILEQDFGADGVLTDEEIAGITSIFVQEKQIQSLKGIEYFTAMTRLICNYNQLTSLDVSNNTALTSLLCNVNQLTSLNISNNNVLEHLNCSRNQLTSLNLSGFSVLEELRCTNNKLTSIEVSGCDELKEIYCYSNQIKGEAMDLLIEGLPITPGWGLLAIIDLEDEQNVMTKAQVAAAKAKGWCPKYKYGTFSSGANAWTDYDGSDEAPVVNFAEGQMATIILPAAPDASKGKYYRLDRAEAGQIIFEQELHPQAHIPYIIVPNEDFNIDLSTLDLVGCYRDTVSVDGISFIGTFVSEEFDYPDGFYIDIIDSTPDCRFDESCVIGALRAYLLVHWDDPYNQGGTRVPPLDKMGIVLRDYETGIASPFRKTEEGSLFDLQGRRVSNPQKGIYIKDGRKVLIK